LFIRGVLFYGYISPDGENNILKPIYSLNSPKIILRMLFFSFSRREYISIETNKNIIFPCRGYTNDWFIPYGELFIVGNIFYGYISPDGENNILKPIYSLNSPNDNSTHVILFFSP